MATYDSGQFSDAESSVDEERAPRDDEGGDGDDDWEPAQRQTQSAEARTHMDHFVPSDSRAQDNERDMFGWGWPNFYDIPPRLKYVNAALINDVNDWHYGMMNDIQRNEAYWAALKKYVKPDDIVLDIGTGSGLLSMLAVKAGCKHVFSIEASKHFHKLASEIIAKNKISDKITLIHNMSTQVTVHDPTLKKRPLPKHLPKLKPGLAKGDWYMARNDETLNKIAKSFEIEDKDALLTTNKQYYPNITLSSRLRHRTYVQVKSFRRRTSPRARRPPAVRLEQDEDLALEYAKQVSLQEQNKLPSPSRLPRRPTVLCAEILGTLLNGESTLKYYQDARRRLLTPDATIIPAAGVQWAVLINSPNLKKITSVDQFQGLDLSNFNRFRDSVSLMFTKHYGVLLRTLGYECLSEPIKIYEADFYTDGPEVQPLNRGRRYKMSITNPGEVHAIMFFWEAFMDRERTISISTDPTKTDLCRDMNWGQALQLIEAPSDFDNPMPRFLSVKQGNVVDLHVACDGVSLYSKVVSVKRGTA